MAVVLAVTWLPIQAGLLPFDGAGRIPFLMMTMGVLLVLPSCWRLFFKGPSLVYFLLAVYMFINAMAKGCVAEMGGTVFAVVSGVFGSLLFMWLLMYLYRCNVNNTLDVLQLAFLLYCLLCLFTNGLSGDRLGTLVNANTIALNAVFSVFVSCFSYLRKHITSTRLACYVVLPLFMIMRSGSRTAFLVFAVTMFYLLILSSRRHGKSRNSILKYAFAVIAAAALFVVTVKFSMVGERVMTTTTQVEGSVSETGTILDIFGDRGLQYYLSWSYFMDNMLTGIGLRKWLTVGITGLVFHSEYLVQYCENGLVGFTLYMTFIVSLFVHMHRSRKAARDSGSSDMAYLSFVTLSLVMIVIINFFYWTYDQYYVFVSYAIATSCGLDAKAQR